MVSPNQIDLFEALERDEITPHFQPIVELQTGKLKGFEVLARWKHTVLGMIPPDNFIPMAEKTGRIGLLTANLLRKVFLAAPAIPSPISLSVNISPVQFHDDTLPQQILQAAADGGFSLHRLILEVTESALVDNLEQTRTIAFRLKELGIRLALDDFGTGYSSLRHLQIFPFDELKVDASFVRSMDHTRESRKIAAAVVGLGHSLGLITVAEGVETKTHAEMMLWLGCEQAQGWLYGRPVPAAEIPGIVSRESLSPPEDAPSVSNLGPMTSRLEGQPAQRLSQLQAIYDGAPVGLCFLDTDMRYTSINKRLAEMNGAPVTDHLGRRVVDVFPEMFEIIEPYIQTALKGESLTGIEITSPRAGADGRSRTLLLSFQSACDEADEVIGVSVAVVDITERKAAEEALKESEDRYRNAAELNPHIPWTASPDFLEIEVSSSWGKLTGMADDPIGDHGWIEAVHPEDVGRATAAVGASLSTGNPLDVELRIRRNDGAWIWLRSRGTPRRDASGKIVRWYGSMEDIDDRKRMEEALIRNEALLKAVFEAVPVGIVIAEASSGRIVLSNPRAESVLGQLEIPAQTIDDYREAGVHHPDGRPLEPRDYPLVRAIVTGELTGPEELILSRKDGSEAWISATAAPVRSSTGEVVAGVVALLPIDDVKRERQALLDRISELQLEIDQLNQLRVQPR
jgi:PAS domain S-box-containing protein